MQSLHENADKDIETILVGNKIDLDRKVSEKEAWNMAEQYNIPYFETSAKENIGVEKAILSLTKAVLNGKKSERSTKVLGEVEETQSGCGC